MDTPYQLPSHLLHWEPMEPEDQGLQVALLTMTLAALVPRLAALESALERLELTGSTAALRRDPDTTTRGGHDGER